MNTLTNFVTGLRNKKRITPSKTGDRPNALENSVLRKVPLEILRAIAELLPPGESASFTLSCRQLSVLLGTQSLEQLQIDPRHTLSFLKLLEHDLPGHIVCLTCVKLHEIKNAHLYIGKNCTQSHQSTVSLSRYYSSGQIMGFLGVPRQMKVLPFAKLKSRFGLAPRRQAQCVSNDQRRRRFQSDHISSTLLKMTLKHYRLFGNDSRTRRLLSLSSTKTYSGAATFQPWTSTTENQCLVRDGALFMRQQVVIKSRWEYLEHKRLCHLVCPHLQFVKFEGDLTLMVREAIGFGCHMYEFDVENDGRDADPDLKPVVQKVIKCRSCYAELTCQLIKRSRGYLSIKLHVWKMFGNNSDNIEREWPAAYLRTHTLAPPLMQSEETSGQGGWGDEVDRMALEHAISFRVM